MKESVEELNKMLDEIEPQLKEYRNYLDSNSSGLEELKDSTKDFLKLHKTVPNTQKDVQTETTRVDGLQVDIEQMKADIESLNKNMKTMLKLDSSDRTEVVADDSKKKQAELKLLEKKLVLGIKESEMNNMENLTKIAADFCCQNAGYGEYMKNYITSNFKLPGEKKSKENVAKEIENDIKKFSIQLTDSIANILSKKERKQFESNAKQYIDKINKVNAEIESLKNQNEDTLEYQISTKLLNDIKNDYRSLNEDFEGQFYELHQVIQEGITKILLNDPEKGKEAVAQLKAYREKVTDLRKKIKERKNYNSEALGRITSFVKTIDLNNKNNTIGNEIIERLKKESGKLEYRFNETQDLHNEKIDQIEKKLNLVIELGNP